MSVSIGNAHVVRSSIEIHANVNVHGEYCAIGHESSAKTLAGVSVTTMEYVSRRSGTVIGIVNASARLSSTALVGRFSATRHAIVSASKNLTVLNHRSLMRRPASVNVQQSSCVELR